MAKNKSNSNVSQNTSETLSVNSSGGGEFPMINYQVLAEEICKIMKKEIEEQFRKSFWQNLMVATILFLLSVIAALLIYIISTLHK